MAFSHRSSGDVAVADISGRFDAYSVTEVKEWIERVTASEKPHAVVNLSGVNFIDSTALATLVQGMKHSRQRDGDLHLCCLQQPVRIIFELTRLDRAFDIYADEKAAVEAFSA